MVDRSPSKVSESHYNQVAEAITANDIVFILGDDINLCGREKNDRGQPKSWREDGETHKYAPTNAELALDLDTIFPDKSYSKIVGCPLIRGGINSLPAECPAKTNRIEKMALQLVAQYMELEDEIDPDTIADELDKRLKAEYTPNPLHEFLAGLTGTMKAKNYSPSLLIVTTCFDNTLENAFKKSRQPFDLVFFGGEDYFEHQRYRQTSNGEIQGDVKPCPIKTANTYLVPEDYPIILKPYGSTRPGQKSTIAEDDCIDYLALKEINNLIPKSITAKLQNSSLLFLGYSLSYWNLRVFLYRIWKEHIKGIKKKTWWVVQSNPDIIDQKFWKKYAGRSPMNISLDDYITRLQERMEREPKIQKSADFSSDRSLSPRDQLRKTLKELIPQQFDDLIWGIDNLPPNTVRQSPALQADRVNDLLLWAESSMGYGLEIIENKLKEIISEASRV